MVKRQLHGMHSGGGSHLGEIVTKYGKNSDLGSIQLHRTKCTKLITEVLDTALKEDLKEDLQGKFFCLIVDETTDISVEKDLAIIIRYFSVKHGKVMDSLLDIVTLSSASGESIFNSIKEVLNSYNLQFTTCVGFGCDGASTMIGQHNSVWSRIRETNPNCILMKCICHSLALCVQHGFDKLPSHMGYLLQEIPAWFSQSRIRRDEFQALFHEINDETQSSYNEMPFLKFSCTRWLSRGKVIFSIHKNWNTLEMYFASIANDPQKLSPAQRYKARELLKMLQDRVNHLYITFALPIVTEFERVNAFFQSNKADPDKVVAELNLHFLSIKSRVYDSHGNPKALSLVDFGAKFLSECNAFLTPETTSRC